MRNKSYFNTNLTYSGYLIKDFVISRRANFTTKNNLFVGIYFFR